MFEKLSGETSLYPIIGDPIIFVKSPQRLTAAFEARDHNGICVPMQAPDGELESVVRGLGLVRNVRGLLITMPHKNSMFAYCATSSETAKLLCVVNVARRNADDSWHGDMLDGVAFVAAQKKKGAKPDGARVLQVGAGGAGSAIAVALLEAGVRELVLHDASQSRLDHLVRLLSGLGLA
jgi:shikimate dehydrogenase